MVILRRVRQRIRGSEVKTMGDGLPQISSTWGRGEILASEAVRQIVAGKKFPFSDRGESTLRGFEDRVHIYQVSWRPDS